LSLKDRIEQNRFVLWLVFLSFPLPFIAILTGWYTAEVGRQPWVVYGVLRTAEAMTPFLDGARGVDLACRWIERPHLFVFPVIGGLAAVVLAVSIRYRRDQSPFPMVILIFLSAFGTLAISFWPYMIPFVLTIDEAAAPHSSLVFMFWGEGLFVFPLMLLYTVISYRVFRGKVASMPGHY
jgi:cytochrome bd-type quinol oxidase subunit 2